MPTRLNYDASRAHESCQAETEKQSTYRRVWDIRHGRTERHRHVIDIINRRMITALKLQGGGAAGSEEIGKRLRDYRVSGDPLFFRHFGRRRVVLWRLTDDIGLSQAERGCRFRGRSGEARKIITNRHQHPTILYDIYCMMLWPYERSLAIRCL